MVARNMSFLANVFLVSVPSYHCCGFIQVRCGDVHQKVLTRLEFLISSSLVRKSTSVPINSL
jgi:hypothetical protein